MCLAPPPVPAPPPPLPAALPPLTAAAPSLLPAAGYLGGFTVAAVVDAPPEEVQRFLSSPGAWPGVYQGVAGVEDVEAAAAPASGATEVAFTLRNIVHVLGTRHTPAFRMRAWADAATGQVRCNPQRNRGRRVGKAGRHRRPHVLAEAPLYPHPGLPTPPAGALPPAAALWHDQNHGGRECGGAAGAGGRPCRAAGARRTGPAGVAGGGASRRRRWRGGARVDAAPTAGLAVRQPARPG